MTTRPAARAADALYPWRAFFLGALLYLLLSVREISGWTKPVWTTLAFLVIPVVCALVLGRGETATAAARFRAAFWSVGLAMALYTAYHLIRLHPTSASVGNVLLLGLVVSLVYALVAAAVCVLTGLLWARSGVGKTDGDR